MTVWVVAAVLFLAYTNGANDNFKGVATLCGSRTADYRQALWWATLTTLVGSCAAIFFPRGLVTAFSGHGLVPGLFTQDPVFLLAVGLGAALTVIAATLTGFPISTTHVLIGALIGAGLAAAGSVNLSQLGYAFFLPLAVSPVLSFALVSGLYPLLRLLRIRLGVEREMCLCLESGALEVVDLQPDGTGVLRTTGQTIAVGQLRQCIQRYRGRIFGIDCQRILDRLHYLSAGAVGFARGLNDTPKIVALMMAAQGLGVSRTTGMMSIGMAMAIGGWLQARKVAVTMSERITAINHGQGFTANLVTALLVTVASRAGWPVSTTHVACGSLFGLGAVNGSARWPVIRTILWAWLITLPLAAALAAGLMWGLRYGS